jgi:hypothetical protein
LICCIRKSGSLWTAVARYSFVAGSLLPNLILFTAQNGYPQQAVDLKAAAVQTDKTIDCHLRKKGLRRSLFEALLNPRWQNQQN